MSYRPAKRCNRIQPGGNHRCATLVHFSSSAVSAELVTFNKNVTISRMLAAKRTNSKLVKPTSDLLKPVFDSNHRVRGATISDGACSARLLSSQMTSCAPESCALRACAERHRYKHTARDPPHVSETVCHLFDSHKEKKIACTEILGTESTATKRAESASYSVFP